MWRTAIFLFFWAWALEGAALATPYIWWSPAPAERLADGRVGQVLTLKIFPQADPARPPEAWLRVTPLRRFNQPGEPETARWRQGEWASADPWTLAVQAGEYAKVDAFAKAEIEGVSHFAQARLLLYGQAGEADPGIFAEAPKNLPEFQISSNGEFYWPQTGHEFTLALAGLAAPGGLEVHSGQGELLDRAEDADGAFKYTPAHDPALDRAGYKAEKPLIFVARNPEGDSASFTLVVRRSRLAGLRPKAGLAVFAAAFLLCGLTTGLARLRERPCS
jgi:hypothetical protein